MRVTRLVLSDLHLAEGCYPPDAFGERQQGAFGALIRTFLATSPLDVCELIINGDCFDFLATAPFTLQRQVEPALALQKIDKIIAAHADFFDDLHVLITQPACSLTFMIGNHDPELAFVEVQRRICRAITGQEQDPRVVFCSSRIYRPRRDIYIEHGHQYDFWNRAIDGLWDEQGLSLSAEPASLLLPFGSVYYQLVLARIAEDYPYFDYWEPHMSNIRQIGLLCLLNPKLVVELAERTMRMLSYPRQALAASVVDQTPIRVFEAALQDFQDFRGDIFDQMLSPNASPVPSSASEISPRDISDFLLVSQALTLPFHEAVAVLCSPVSEPGSDDETVTLGMQAVLHDDPAVRYAIAGHTHSARADTLASGQIYFNSGTWTERYAQPAPSDLTLTLLNWLHKPDWRQVPLRDLTCLTFVLLTTVDDEPTEGHLCVWEGDHYQILH